ncbi:MAG: phosphatase PAP2 family protein [Acidimicrobiales bacterium]|nr:phosphatase PAP2 family protein [Acidimicrobiales bacterium]
MTAVGSTGSPERARRVDPGASEGLHWWREVLLAAVFYAVYSQVRNLFGAGPESRTIAFRHARGVIEVEEWVGLWFEPRLQQWYLALPHDGLIRFWNIFYGTAHFVVTIGVLVLAYRRLPQRYRFIRTMLAGTTALALVGFATYTLMPPRLLDVDSAFGACKGQGAECHGYGIVDTIEVWGGLWSFGEGAMAEISNQYAAMPSLHFGWSSWCAITMVMVIGRGWKRWLWFLYPTITLFCILVTGNHYWLDALFGAVALGGGALIAAGVERLTERRRARAATPPADRGTSSAPTAGSHPPASA